GGSMFEELMPALFVPEETIAPNSWGLNHPEGGYGAYGVDGVGMDPNGNPSNEDDTLIDHGWDDPACEIPPTPDPPPSAYTNGVVTPHAAFLALRYAPQAATTDIQELAAQFPGLYDHWGFHDSVNVMTGYVSDSYLSLDQGMIMAALGNALGNDALRHAFTDPSMERRAPRQGPRLLDGHRASGRRCGAATTTSALSTCCSDFCAPTTTASALC